MVEKSSGKKTSRAATGKSAKSSKSAKTAKTAKSAKPSGSTTRKTTAGRGRRRQSAPDSRRAIMDAALNLAAERGWRDLSLFEIAEASGQPLSTVYDIFPSKTAILAGFLHDVEAEALGSVTPGDFDPDETARDRLFDVVMRGFDALVPHKKAVGEIAYDIMRDPVAAMAVLPAVAGTMSRTLETAGLSASGLRGAVRVKGLMAICLGSLRSFLRDDTADMAKTMATLDGYLRRVESLACTLETAGRRRSAGEEPASPEA